MAVLNPPGALPGLARAIADYLVTKPSHSESTELIRSLFAPATHADPMPDDRQPGSKNLDDTLAVGRGIGLFLRKDGIELAPIAVEAAGGAQFTRTRFRALLRRLLLDPARDGDPWDVDDGEGSTTGARDFARATTWLLAHDALGPPLSWTGPPESSVEELQRRRPPTVLEPVGNGTRWGALRRWAPYAGLARVTTVGPAGVAHLYPDPTEAIREEFPSLLNRELQPVKPLLERLSRALPVIAGGVYREALDRRLDTPIDPSVRQMALDTSVAQALMSLDEEELIVLGHMSDAEGVVTIIDESGGTRLVTHIGLRSEAKR